MDASGVLDVVQTATGTYQIALLAPPADPSQLVPLASLRLSDLTSGLTISVITPLPGDIVIQVETYSGGVHANRSFFFAVFQLPT